jgi:hypothetical protein
MTALPSIDKPTPFSSWLQTKALFDDGTPMTETYVTDGHDEGVRYAYGKCAEGWCFYIAMTPEEEPVFWQIYNEWRNRNPTSAQHVATVNNRKPPNCGTPNTPQCPDLVSGEKGVLTLGPSASGASGGATGDVRAA